MVKKHQNASRLSLLKNKIFEYIRTSRLSAWMTAAVFFLLGEWYSLGTIPFYQSIFALLALGGILSSTSWINFVFDKELDSFAGQDVSFFKYISPREMLLISTILSIISLVLLLYLNYLMFLVGLLIIIVGVLYSIPPLRLKIHPPLDSIVNALEFGTLPILLGIVSAKYFSFNSTLFVLLIVASLIVVSYYLLIDILDLETDKNYGVKTSVTVLGLNRTIDVSLITFFFSFILSIIFFGIFSLISISLIICIPIILVIKIKNDHDSIAKILSSISLVWTESILLFLFVLSRSIIPLVIFVLVLLSASYFIYVYLTIIKKSKTEKLH